MEGTKMTKQEHASMLYEEFDKFTYEPGESIYSYYIRYAKLINDMNMIPMSMSNIQINTKFVNHLQLECSRFATTTKQARDLHVVNFYQLYAFLKHNEKDAKEVLEMRQRFPYPLALLAKTYNSPLSYSSQNIQYHSQPPEVYQPYQYYQSTTPVNQQLIQSPPKQSYALSVVPQQPPMMLTQTDSRFVVPIASLNKALIFLKSAYSSRYPPTNSQLRTSSNPITQATIQNGQVMVQNVQGRQSQG
ncbi:hypothetical protein Tco_0155905 [Tanacetum coccineum]